MSAPRQDYCNTSITTPTSRTKVPKWQSHRHTESIDSETSFFDQSSSTSTTTDSWSGYFDGWNDNVDDAYCPQIVSASNSPTRSNQSDKTPTFDPEGLLPSACPQRTRPSSRTSNAVRTHSPKPQRRSKRHGIVPHANPDGGVNAAAHLDSLLQNSMSNTEDILEAMYSPDWDATSLHRWYEGSQKSPADLALFKIMFSLRYSTDIISPMSH